MYLSAHTLSTVTAMPHFPESRDPEFQPVHSTTVTLPPADVDWASQIALSASATPLPWQDFLRALALRGFQQWVAAGALDVALYYDAAQVPPATITCQVAGFRLCLIALGGVSPEAVPIPITTVESPDQFAHLYVLIDVEEEVDRVTILSCLRRDRLLAYQHSTPLTLNADNTYAMPVRQFDTAPEDLLLYFTCLAPEQIATAAGAAIATAPAQSPIAAAASLAQNLDTALINVGSWLQNQLDEVAEQLAWTLLPPVPQLNAAPALRSPVEEMGDILTGVQAAVAVPPYARGAYIDCQQSGIAVRLYALTWPIFHGQQPEWSLLLCVSPADHPPLLPGVRLVIRDNTSVLVQQTLAPTSESTYLYGQVIGTWEETFTVTVELPDGDRLTWPPFAFQPHS